MSYSKTVRDSSACTVGIGIMPTGTRLIAVAVVLVALPGPAPAYIDAPPTLGRLVRFDATNIVVMQVEKVSRDKQAIIYKKVADLKGKYPADRIKQHVSRRIADAPGPEDNPRPRGGKSILDWAEPGKLAIFFHDGNRVPPSTVFPGRRRFASTYRAAFEVVIAYPVREVLELLRSQLAEVAAKDDGQLLHRRPKTGYCGSVRAM